MKRNKKSSMTGAILSRVGIMLLTLAILGGVLTGCSGCGSSTTTAQKLTLTESVIDPSEENGNKMDKDHLLWLAKDIAGHTDALTIREQLVAAYNGYDMTASDFNDENVSKENAQTDRSVDFAINVLEKYKTVNDKEVISSIAYATANMTRADLEMLIQSFQTAVVLEDDIGFFTRILMWIAIAFEWMINTLGFGSFILGTVFFAIAVEIIMLPISILQQKNARKQARLRPKEMAIRKKYAGRTDQATMQTMQQEIMQMQQDEGVSAMSSGCLPLLISLPIVFALYYVVIDPLKYMMGCSTELASALNTFATTSRAAGGLGLSLQSNRGTIEILSYIRDMGVEGLASLKDFAFFSNSTDCLSTLTDILNTHTIPNFNIASVNFGLTPGLDAPWLLIIPALTFGVYFASSKLTRKMSYQPTTANDPGMGCSNAIMDISMPLMSAIFTFWVPGAVGLYWAIKSIVGLGKQFIMSKVMPLPVFTEADYKAAERELAGKNKNKPVKKSGTRNPNVRSLHHIDDEDFEPGSKATYPEPPSKSDAAESPRESTNETTYSEGAVLKEDLSAEERRAQKKNKNKKKDGDTAADTTDTQADVSDADNE